MIGSINDSEKRSLLKAIKVSLQSEGDGKYPLSNAHTHPQFSQTIVKNVRSLKQIYGPDPSYICFSGAGSNVSELSRFFPEVEMIFGNGQKLSLAPENYLFQHPNQGVYCLSVLENEDDATTILGGTFFRNNLVTFDPENQRIGFYKTNCSELWERLHSH